MFNNHYAEDDENNRSNIGVDFDVQQNFDFRDTFLDIMDSHIDDILFNIQTYVNSVYEEELLTQVIDESFHNQPSNFYRKDDYIPFSYKKYSDSDKIDKECSICLVEYESNDLVSITECGHLFHNKCIEEWSRYKQDCPVCRNNLKEEKK
jgi:hypothetical protein